MTRVKMNTINSYEEYALKIKYNMTDFENSLSIITRNS